MEQIPDEYLDLFTEAAHAVLATVMPDGTPHPTVVWVDIDDDGYVLVNTQRGRQKERNIMREPKVGITVIDPSDPYRYVSVLGEVEEVVEDGARAHIGELGRRYEGVDDFEDRFPAEVTRVILRIRPDRVIPVLA